MLFSGLLCPAHIDLQSVVAFDEVQELHVVESILVAVGVRDHISEVDSGPILTDQNVVDAHALLMLDHILHGGL